MKTDSTFLGNVVGVVGGEVTVEISPDIPSSSPIVEGKLHRIGQVGSFVRIPVGYLNLYGIVSMVGAAELLEREAAVLPFIKGRRWIKVQLVGESYRGEEFHRGVGTYPTIDDEVHLVTGDDLAAIYSMQSEAQIEIGHLSASEALAATLSLEKMVTRHVAIVGSTGSGKSNAVARLLGGILKGGYPGASMVVIDPHGEYSTAFSDTSRVYRIDDKENPLYVPFWTLTFDELTETIFGKTADPLLRNDVERLKKRNAKHLRAGCVSTDDLTVDSPIPFDLKSLWWRLEWRDRQTLASKTPPRNALADRGNKQGVVPPKFRPPSPLNTPPFQGPLYGRYRRVADHVLGRLKDRRYQFLVSPGPYDGKQRDLHDLLEGWLCHERLITIFDLSGVPFEVVDVAVGVLTRLIFDCMFWGQYSSGVGRHRPTFLVFEEAHRYLQREPDSFQHGYARKSVERIFKEGRKYGLGAAVVTQRPSELSEAILSQCGTFIAMRLSNSQDQGQVGSAMPDTLKGLTDLLPSLRTGEALIVGEAVPIPSRVRIDLVTPRPTSADPEIAAAWRNERIGKPDFARLVTAWRRQMRERDG